MSVLWSLLQPVSLPSSPIEVAEKGVRAPPGPSLATLAPQKILAEPHPPSAAPAQAAVDAPDTFAMPGAWLVGPSEKAAPTPSPSSRSDVPSTRAIGSISSERRAQRPQLALPLPPPPKLPIEFVCAPSEGAPAGASAAKVDGSPASPLYDPTLLQNPRFVRWLTSLKATTPPESISSRPSVMSQLIGSSWSTASIITPSYDRDGRWREREDTMIRCAWHLEMALPKVAKVGLVSSMKAGALSSGAYSLFLPWFIMTYPFVGFFTPIVIAVLFGVSVGIGALAQELTRIWAVRRDRQSEVPQYDDSLAQLIALQAELQLIKRGRPAEFGRPAIRGRILDLRETQQLKQLNALRLRYEGGFVNLVRQAIEAVIDGHAVPELHLK